MYDFRSDTVTRPTEAMLRAMQHAPVGDDVLGDDPTVLKLQEKVADLLGKEQALFVPSGTMSNLIAIALHCRPGDEMVCDENAHIYIYEQGGYAQINGVCVRTLPGERGIFTAEQLQGHLRKPNLHSPDIKAVALENTHNRGGGSIWAQENVLDVCQLAKKRGLSTHLDGARLMNAVVATGLSASELAKPFDTVSLCFSKGLACPVGSILAGPTDWMHRALRRRKVLGGGMRQVGILAVAAIYALDHHVNRLADDHENARRLADAIRNIDPKLVRLKYEKTETNMMFFDILSPRIVKAASDDGLTPAEYFSRILSEQGILMLATAPTTLRAVTHLDVDVIAVDKAAEAIRRIAEM
jgi:threonine aldolase